MNHRYMRIVMTCLMVGIVMIFLRKPTETPSQMPETASVMQAQDEHEQSILSNTIENTEQPTQQEKENQPKPNLKKNETKKEKRDARVKAKKEARKNKAPARTETPHESETDFSNTHEPTQSNEDKKEQKATPIQCTTQPCGITLKPAISSKDFSYKYGFFKYSPTSISLTINGEDIEANDYDPINIEVDKNNIITACCKYTFIAGYEGVVVTTWKVKPGGTYDVTFSWKTPEKILIDGDGIELLNTKNDAKSGRGHADQKEHETDSASSEDTEQDDNDDDANEEEDISSIEPPNKSATILHHTPTKKTLKFLK